MGLIQNKVTVSQPNSHVVVKNAGGLRGLTGETGPQGPQGVPGQAATVTVGTTTTLPAGSNATVQNVGSTSAAIFNFGIPKGDKGDTGESGAAATISVGATTTLEPGEDATVTNSGTSSAAVFDFGIPQGAKGDTGDTGPAGADGFSPTATVSKTGDTATITITDKNGTTTAQISDGTTPTIDPALSPTSENPVQNKVVTNALAGKADKPIIVSSLPATGTAGQEYLVDDRYNTVTELKGDTEQTTYSGKNIVTTDGVSTTTQGGMTMTVEPDGSLTFNSNGASTSAFSGRCSKHMGALAAGTYTFSRTSTGEGDWSVTIILYRAGNVSVFSNSGPNPTTFTLTEDTTDYWLYAYIVSGTTLTNYNIKLQIEKGSTATSFEPYVGGIASPNPDYPQEVQTVTGEQTITISDGDSQSQTYTVNLGKNLLNTTLTPENKFLNSSGGWTTAPGTDTFLNQELQVEGGMTLTFSQNGRSNANTWLRLGEYKLDGTFIQRDLIGENSSNTITIDASCRKLVISMDFGPTNYYTEPMLEKGSTATTYAPYFTPIELCKIGTNQDYIYKSGEDWYVHKEIGKVVLDGTTGYWNYIDVRTNTTRFGVNSSDLFSSYNAGTSFYSQYFVYGLAYNTDAVCARLYGGNILYMSVPKGIGTTLGDINTPGTLLYWVNQNMPVFYLPTATSTDTQITDAALIAQLEALAGAKIMVDGGTATVTSQYLPATLTTAYSSNSGYIDYIYDGTNFVKVR